MYKMLLVKHYIKHYKIYFKICEKSNTGQAIATALRTAICLGSKADLWVLLVETGEFNLISRCKAISIFLTSEWTILWGEIYKKLWNDCRYRESRNTKEKKRYGSHWKEQQATFVNKFQWARKQTDRRQNSPAAKQDVAHKGNQRGSTAQEKSEPRSRA